jgi:hypothetical protein
MDVPTRIALEALYSILLSAVVQLARVLGKDCPVQTREGRRQARQIVVE